MKVKNRSLSSILCSRKAVQETLRATHEHEGDRKIGVIWHTQGSGKSLSMVFYTGQIVVEPEMKNPTIVILTDRNDLDDQLLRLLEIVSNYSDKLPSKQKIENI